MKFLFGTAALLLSGLSEANYTKIYHVEAQNVMASAIAREAALVYSAGSVKFLEISQGKYSKDFSDFFFQIRLDSGLGCNVIAKARLELSNRKWSVDPNHPLKFNCGPE
ncbi:MAG TPA: hypothetical protein VNJ01_18090 [Bacteriovoracaceae bacterium]|nr:hypothetical protein [Bacteriovoracaceae bacterium]